MQTQSTLNNAIYTAFDRLSMCAKSSAWAECPDQAVSARAEIPMSPGICPERALQGQARNVLLTSPYCRLVSTDKGEGRLVQGTCRVRCGVRMGQDAGLVQAAGAYVNQCQLDGLHLSKGDVTVCKSST